MLVIGVDEVGLGPAFGPVVACAYHPTHTQELSELLEWGKFEGKDSKKRSHSQRSSLLPRLKMYGCYKIGVGSVSEINSLNICQASLLAMRRAVEGVCKVIKPDRILVDGKNLIPGIDRRMQSAVIRGDATCPAIAAASILAKEFRDSLICQLATWPQFSMYHLSQHKGYTTSPRKGEAGIHETAIALHGVSPLHHIHNKAVVRAQARFLGLDPMSVFDQTNDQPTKESELCLQLQQLNLF